MISFERIITGRMNVGLNEITIGHAANLLSKKERKHEQDTSYFLDAVTDTTAMPDHLKNPRKWTVHERALVLSSYLSQVSDRKDFAIGEQGKLSDYVSFEHALSPAESVEVLGVLEGDRWGIVPLTGSMAEHMEATVSVILNGGRTGYMIAAMACQLRLFKEDSQTFESVPCATDEPMLFLEFLSKRIEILTNLPESSFMQLFMMFRHGMERLNHFFKNEISDDGIVFLAQKESEDGTQLPPTMFCVDDCISQPSRYFIEKPE